jgi:hypothetical protein
LFHLESVGSFDAQDVLPKKYLFSFLVMEENGFDFCFQRGRVLIHPYKVSENIVVLIGLERIAYTGLIESMFRIWYMRVTSYVIYGTGGWDTYTTRHF